MVQIIALVLLLSIQSFAGDAPKNFVSSVTGSAPLSSSGGFTPNLSITQSTTSANGYLSSADWNTFNGKQAALGYTPVNKAGDTMTGSLGILSNEVSISNAITNLGWGGVSSIGPGMLINSVIAASTNPWFLFGSSDTTDTTHPADIGFVGGSINTDSGDSTASGINFVSGGVYNAGSSATTGSVLFGTGLNMGSGGNGGILFVNDGSNPFTNSFSGGDTKFITHTFTVNTTNGSSFSGGTLDVNSNEIINVTDPTSSQHAATKNYVDTRIGGWKTDIDFTPSANFGYSGSGGTFKYHRTIDNMSAHFVFVAANTSGNPATITPGSLHVIGSPNETVGFWCRVATGSTTEFDSGFCGPMFIDPVTDNTKLYFANNSSGGDYFKKGASSIFVSGDTVSITIDGLQISEWAP